MMLQSPASPSDAPLPALRQDIEFLAGGPDKSGAPTWVIHDPLQNRYFHISRETHAMLVGWRSGVTMNSLAAEVGRELGIAIDEQEVKSLVEFLARSNLTISADGQDWRELARRAASMRGSLLHRLLHSYLFFKIPLVRPQARLEAALPYVEFLYTRRAAAIIAAMGALGLYLTSRQWDVFLNTFHDFASWDGAVQLAVTLALTKSLHELGHALTAVRFGCRVPAMGLAFMVLAPLLYTDVTDAWRLQSRRQRLLIHGAGILVELALACIATLLWAFLPDGGLRSAAFTLATLTWIMTLAINLNPLMKFDGYYLFAEFIGIDNLQSRAGALGQWKLRQILIAPGLPPPEPLDRRWRNGLIAYAWASWLYRLIVFTGIALLVYHYFFKALGIILFGVEIWYFILRPVVHEVREWIKMMPQVASPRRLSISGALLVLGLLALALPLSSTIEVPAVAEADPLVRLYPPRPARVASVDVERGAVVKAGDRIATLELPEVDHEINTTRIRIGLVSLRLGRITDDEKDRQETLVLRNELATLKTRLAGLDKEKAELVIRAPMAGRVLELPSYLHAGRWIGKADLLAMIADQSRPTVRGYLDGPKLFRLYDRAPGRFIPDDLTRPAFGVTLASVAKAGATTVDMPELASVHGGAVAVTQDASHALTPVTAQYRVELRPDQPGLLLDTSVRGVVQLSAWRESLAMRAFRQISKVLIRESGF